MELVIIMLIGLAVCVTIEIIEKRNHFELQRKWECLIALFLFIASSFILMKQFGIIDSGYHLIDDHEIFTFRDGIKDSGYIGNLYFRLSNDLNLRFRPTYILLRTLYIYLVKDNYIIWHCTITLIGGINLFLLYLLARETDCEKTVSYVFSIITFIGGGQSAILYRLGPQESVALLFLLLLLLLLNKYIHSSNRTYLFPIIVLEILMGWFKESFLIMLPIIPLWVTFISINNSQVEFNFRNIIKKLFEQKILLISSLLLFLGGVYITVFRTGVEGVSYAGLATEFGITDWLKAFYYIATGRLMPYLIFAILSTILLIVVSILRKPSKSILFETFFCFFIFAYLIGTQFVIYGKSDMYERYLIPSVFILLAWAILGVSYFLKKSNCQKTSIVFQCAIILFGIIMFMRIDDQNRAIAYAEDGQDTTALLLQVGEFADYEKDLSVVSDIGYEADYSVGIFLKNNFDIDNVVSLNSMEDTDTFFFENQDIFIGTTEKIRALIETENELKNYYVYSYGDYQLLVSPETQ